MELVVPLSQLKCEDEEGEGKRSHVTGKRSHVTGGGNVMKGSSKRGLDSGYK